MQEITKDQIYNMSDEEFEKVMQSGEYIQQAKNIDDSSDDNDKGEDTSIDNSKDLGDNTSNTNPEQQSNDKLDSNDSSDTSNEQPLDNSDETEPTQEVEKFSIKANGQRFEFTKDELIKLAPKALNYTKKMQAIAPYRRSISAMQENGLTEDDINQLIEMKRGNRTAISNFLNKHNISTLDLDESQSYDYTPNKYGREQNELTETLEELQSYPPQAVTTLTNYIDSLDKVSRETMQQHPHILRTLMNDIESGDFDRIQPEANKRAFLDENKKPGLDYYIQVANELLQHTQRKMESDSRVNKEAKIQNIRDKTRMSGNRKQTEAPKKVIKSAFDITDEELEAFEKQIGVIY